MSNNELLYKVKKLLEKDLDALISVAKERVDDYEENCSKYESGHENCVSEDDASYHEGFGEQLGEVVEVLTKLNEFKQALAAK